VGVSGALRERRGGVSELRVKKTDLGLEVEIKFVASRGSMAGVSSAGCVHVIGEGCAWSRCGLASVDAMGLITDNMDLSDYHFCSRCLIDFR
jgi:hypothetical protein